MCCWPLALTPESATVLPVGEEEGREGKREGKKERGWESIRCKKRKDGGRLEAPRPLCGLRSSVTGRPQVGVTVGVLILQLPVGLGHWLEAAPREDISTAWGSAQGQGILGSLLCCRWRLAGACSRPHHTPSHSSVCCSPRCTLCELRSALQVWDVLGDSTEGFILTIGAEVRLCKLWMVVVINTGRLGQRLSNAGWSDVNSAAVGVSRSLGV